MAKFNEHIDMSITPKIPILESTPEIYWMKLSYDRNPICDTESSTVPRLEEIRDRLDDKNNHVLFGSKLFWKKLLNSGKVFLLDKHLDQDFINRLEKELRDRGPIADSFHIRILSSKISDLKKEVVKNIENMAKENNGKFELKAIKDAKRDPAAFPIHDRFAYFDGELWHFGSNVGGGHRSMTAFTTGWKETNFEYFFEEIWKSGKKI